MSRRIGLVANPTAGHGRGGRLLSEVHRGLSAQGREVVDLSATTFADALHNARAGLVASLDAVVVMGGDGMVHLGANVLAGTATPMGVIAVGSGNDAATALGLPVHDVDAALAVIDRALDRGTPRRIDAVAVSTPGRSTHRWYVSALCTGIDAAVADHATRLSWPGGGGRYVRAMLAELASFTPYGFRITADGHTWEQAATLVTVANTSMFGGGMRIAPEAEPDDGLIDLVVVDGISRTTLLRVFPRIYSGRHVTHPAVNIRRVRSVRLEPLTSAGANPPLAIADGERVTALPLQLDVHPAALGVLA